MPRITGAGLQLRIYGAENARGSIIQFRETTRDRIRAVLESEAPFAVERMRAAMRAAYPMGGKTAESIEGEVTESVTGPTVRISVGNYREVKYLTTLLPDSDFRGSPYPIVPVNKERLQFYFHNAYGGPRWVNLKKVMHPGFGRQGDVLRSSGEEALIQLGQAVEYEVRSAVADVSSGGSIYSASRRRTRG